MVLNVTSYIIRGTTLKNFLKRLYRMLLAFFLSLQSFGMQVNPQNGLPVGARNAKWIFFRSQYHYFWNGFTHQDCKKQTILSIDVQLWIVPILKDYYVLNILKTNLKVYIAKICKYKKNANDGMYRHFREVLSGSPSGQLQQAILDVCVHFQAIRWTRPIVT